MRRLRSQDGMVLPELLVGMVLALAVFAATMGALEVFYNQSSRSERQSQAQDTARNAIDRLATFARNATAYVPTSGVTFRPVEQASTTNLVFLSPSASASLTNNPQGLVHMRYCLDATTPSNEKLWMQTAPFDSMTQSTPPSTTSCPDPSAAWTSKQVVATRIVNGLSTPAKPLFVLPTDSSGAVTDIGMDLWVDVDPTGGAPASELQSSVTLRNLNHAPVANLTCTPTGNGNVSCDASASTDPDGQTLVYSWAMDGTTIPKESGYRLDKTGLTGGSTHTFTVTVTDSGGSSTSTTSPTVTVL
jgi:type II secretory pathway pseudopilin PulG